MNSQNELKKIIEQVLNEMNISTDKKEAVEQAILNQTSEDFIEDITTVDLKKQYLVPNPINGEAFLEMKQHNPARLGIWRAGARYKTTTALRCRADHSVAQNAVFSYVSEEFLKEMDLFTVNTMCKDKDEYVTRPDLGKIINDEGLALIKEKCKKSPKVQIIVADGLSSSAIEANVSDVLPAIIQGLKGYGIDVGTTFFIRLSRVGAMDVVSEQTGADVTCLLIGERPGLVTAKSMSVYIAYKATVNMPEARRTVISNVHKGGTLPVEAGAHIAEIIKMMLEKKISGTELKL